MKSLLYFVLLLFTSLALPTLLIRSRPYDRHDMQSLFAPEGCPMPCFVGIRPGLTNVEDAVAALEASGLVSNIRVDRRLGFVRWEWKGQPPAGVSDREPSYLSFVKDIISIINLPTTLEYGDFFMRTPEFLNMWPMMMGIREEDNDTQMTVWFEREEYSLRIAVSCHDLWHSPVVVLLNSNPPNFPLVDSVDNGVSVVNSIFRVCGQDGSASLMAEQP